MRGLGVAGELDLLVGRQLQNLFDALTNASESFTALLGAAAFTSGHITLTTVGDALASGTGPDTDTIEGFADVDNYAHDLTVLLFFQSVADGSKHYVQPQVVDVDAALVFELVGPFATVFVLRVLPLRSHAGFEEVVIGLEGEVGDWCDVVLDNTVSIDLDKGSLEERTYVDAPKLLNRVESDDLLEKIIPVIALRPTSTLASDFWMGYRGGNKSGDKPCQMRAW